LTRCSTARSSSQVNGPSTPAASKVAIGLVTSSTTSGPTMMNDCEMSLTAGTSASPTNSCTVS
jgi:hypothetical protein